MKVTFQLYMRISSMPTASQTSETTSPLTISHQPARLPRFPVAKFLESKGFKPKDFNTFGSRRGKKKIMARKILAMLRLIN